MPERAGLVCARPSLGHCAQDSDVQRRCSLLASLPHKARGARTRQAVHEGGVQHPVGTQTLPTEEDVLTSVLESGVCPSQIGVHFFGGKKEQMRAEG